MQLFDQLITHLPLLSIPFISAIVGWSTNFLAVKMMFYPIEFIGFKPYLGWQGLIPAKRRECDERVCTTVVGIFAGARQKPCICKGRS